MNRIAQLIDRFSDSLGRTVAWASLVMVLLMVSIVVLRYLFQFGSIAMQESVMYINALIFVLGAGYTLKEQGHVRVDVLYSKLTESRRGLIDLCGTLLLLLPSMAAIIWLSWDYVALSWRLREGSAESSGLPFVYLLKSGILLLALLMLLQGVAELIKSWRRWRAESDT